MACSAALRCRLARAVVIGLALWPAAPASAKDKDRSADKSDKGKKDKSGKEAERPRGPASLQIESIDAEGGRVVVRVGGAAKAPDGRLFSFHDDRGRHFIALHAECAPAPAQPSPSPASDPESTRSAASAVPASHTIEGEALRCELTVPRAYLRRGWVRAMTVRMGGREVAAGAAEVIAKFSAAQAKLEMVVAGRTGARDLDAPRPTPPPPPPPDDPGVTMEPSAEPPIPEAAEGEPEQDGDPGVD